MQPIGGLGGKGGMGGKRWQGFVACVDPSWHWLRWRQRIGYGRYGHGTSAWRYGYGSRYGHGSGTWDGPEAQLESHRKKTLRNTHKEPNGDGLHPSSDGLQPNSDGL